MALSPAMKVLWRELADRKIKEHHGPVKTTRLAAIESRKGRLSSSGRAEAIRAKRPRRWHLFSTGLPPGFWGQRLPTIVLRMAK